MEYLSAQMKSIWEQYTTVICCLGLEIKPIIEVYHPNRFFFLKRFTQKCYIGDSIPLAYTWRGDNFQAKSRFKSG